MSPETGSINQGNDILDSQENQTGELLSGLRHELESTIQDNTLKGLANEELNELKMALYETNINTEEEVKEFKNDLRALDNIEEVYQGLAEGYDVFLAFISKLSGDSQEEMYHILATKKTKVKRYIKKNGDGYPNSQTIESFNDKFGGNVSIVNENYQEREKQTLESTSAYIENIKKLIVFVKREELQQVFPKIFTDITNSMGKNMDNPIELEKLYQRLLQGNLLEDVFQALQKYDEQNQNRTTTFQDFTRVLSGISPAFEQRVQRYLDIQEKRMKSDEVSDLGKAQILAGSYDNVERDGVIRRSFTEKGDTVEINIATKPPLRTYSLEGSNYKMPADMPVANLYPATVVYERVRMEYAPKLQTTENAIRFLQENGIDQMGLADVKESLRQILGYTYYSELGIEQAETKDQIQGQVLSRLQSNAQEFQVKLTAAKSKYRTMLRDAMNEYRSNLREKDERTRETLKFLSSIGFDLIPQSTTDQVIVTLNSNTGLRAQLGITGEINLAEGKLGVNKDGGDIEINAAEKVVFAKLVNRMISGSEDGPINVLAIQSGSGVPVQNRTAFKAELGEIVNTNGYGVAMENLRNSLGQDIAKNSYGEEWATGSGGKVVSDGSGTGHDVMGGGGN